jgi:hypothetical protein
MSQIERGIILKSLHELSEQVGQAEDLLSHGEDVASLQLILGIKKLIRQVVVILVAQCLRKNLEAIDSEDQHSSETRLQDLVEMMNFALLALCLECRQQIGAKLKEV